MTQTIEEFRNDIDKIHEWKAVLDMPITQEVLRVLRDNGPEFEKLGAGMSAIDATLKLGLEHGYAEHHANLEEMAMRWPQKGTAPENTYEPEPEIEE